MGVYTILRITKKIHSNWELSNL